MRSTQRTWPSTITRQVSRAPIDAEVMQLIVMCATTTEQFTAGKRRVSLAAGNAHAVTTVVPSAGPKLLWQGRQGQKAG
jgi:hypothetical protein